MPKFLVKGRIKPGKKADLAARLKDGTLAEGAPYQDALVEALLEGHAVRDEVYFMIESRSDALPDERPTLEGFLEVVSVLRVNEVSEAEFDEIERLDPLPDVAGVDP